MSDPISWLLVERGWNVVDSAGSDVGTVDEVRGDTEKDIFNGLEVSSSIFGRSHFVPSEHVAKIVEGCVHLDLDGDGLKRLEQAAS